MIIKTELCGVTETGANIGVKIKKERPKKAEGIPEVLDNIVGDLYETMEIVSILKALRDSYGAFYRGGISRGRGGRG